MRPEYYFDNNLRWSFYWENPNHWALLLVYMIVGVWLVDVFISKMKRSTPRWLGRIVLYVFEIFLWVLLVKTYSRGGLIAVCVSVVFFFALLRQQWRARFASIGIRVLCVAALCLALGTGKRMTPTYLAQDRSVTNRLQIWQGALVLIHDSPVQGWGHQNGGLSYINWYQSHTAQERPVGFSNSFLEIAVEQGLPIFGGVLALLTFALSLSVRKRRNPIAVTGGSCIVAWAVANFWSSLWIVPALWLVPAAAVIVLLIINVRAYKVILCIFLPAAAMAGVVLPAVLFGFGAYLAPRYAWKVVPSVQTEQLLMVKRTQEHAIPKHVLWVDAAIFGRFYGKIVRSHLEATGLNALLISHPWAKKSSIPHAGMTHVYSGFHAERIHFNSSMATNVILLHPTVNPPDNLGCNLRIKLFLPQYDQSAFRLPWEIWARNHDISVHHTCQGGQLISSSTNGVLAKIIKDDF